MTKRTEPRVYSIPSGRAFLPTIAAALCDGDLVPGFKHGGDPLSLARATIFVPTRRAARELRSAFMDYLGGESVLLPQIRPLGEFDEEAAFFEGNADTFLGTPAPIDPLERQLLLGGLIADWNKHLNDRLREFYKDENLTTPVSTADAFWLSRDLAELLDQLQTEDLTFSQIDAAAAELDLPAWWGVTHAFLRVISDEWPAKLKELGKVDPATHRNAMLRGEAKRLAALQPNDPVIVAGSTGTIPATADLISTIARLPCGAVVLPGYDLSMSDATKTVLEHPENIASAIGHPQYGMHHLVTKMGAQGLVERLGLAADEAAQERAKWVSIALEPASRSATWSELRHGISDVAFDGVEFLTAENEREEAAGIAAALREAIADEHVTAALVTPDRMLARRVVSELARYGIEADDSGGTGFDITNHGMLLGTLFSCVFDPGDPATLLALLKNPLVQIGMNSDAHRHDTELLERLVLRGGVGRFEPKGFSKFAEIQINAWNEKGRYKPEWFASISEDDRQAALELANRFENAVCELLVCRPSMGLEELLNATIKSLEALTANQDNDHSPLYETEAGQMLCGFLTQFLASDTGLKIKPNQWPEIVRAFTSSLLVKPTAGGHPRVSIWGALEGRLQSVDFLILGGLNEGVWPRQTANDAFLTRSMKSKMTMQPPERRIGLAAHDFQQGMGQSRVLLTRSARLENAPAVASRWLQRLETLAGENIVRKLRKKGDRYVRMVEATHDLTGTELERRPEPMPPIEARPTHFSVTEVERLRRDPYAIYAKKILKLSPLDPLVRDPDAASRGTLIHAILEAATEAGIDYQKDDADASLRRIADGVFAKHALPKDIEIVWRTRFEGAISAIVNWERNRDADVEARFAELSSTYLFVSDTGVTLSGRADRLDLRVDGTIDVIDFKTGGVPSADQVRSMLSPQMPLEAALLKRGAFDTLGERDANGLLYVTLGAKGDVDIFDVRGSGKKFVEADVLAQTAWEKLTDILAFYGSEANGYISRAIPAMQHDFSGEYDHLARVLEWSSGVDKGDAGSSSS